MKFYCDNQTAVEFVKNPYLRGTPTWVDMKNINLKIQIRDRMQSSGIKIVDLHVKSHQDDEVLGQEFSKDAKIDCVCDKLSQQCDESLEEETAQETQEWSERMEIMVKIREYI